MTTTISDITAQSARGTLVLSVEVKNRKGLTPEIARSLYDSYEPFVSRSRFYMIVSPDRTYVFDRLNVEGGGDGLVGQFATQDIPERLAPPTSRREMTESLLEA